MTNVPRIVVLEDEQQRLDALATTLDRHGEVATDEARTDEATTHASGSWCLISVWLPGNWRA